MKNILAATKAFPMKLISFIEGVLYSSEPIKSTNLGTALLAIGDNDATGTIGTIINKKIPNDVIKSNREILRTGIIGVHYSYSYKNERRRIVGFRVTHNGKINKSFSFQNTP